ncbi:MAG: site-specific tyrosine recombinase/integron integrase [Promethearchaeota archaeon]
MSIQIYIDEFLIAKELEEGCSPNTINAYRHDLEMFQKILPDDISIEKITPSHIRIFLMHLKKKKYTKWGISRKIACLKSFFKYLELNEIIKINPMKKISSPKIKQEEHLPKYLTEQEIIDFMNFLKEGKGLSYHTRKRIYLIVRLLYSTMARVSEIANAKIGDIDFDNGLIRLRGKGNKERIVPIDPETLNLIQEYLKDRIIYNKEDPLLINAYGKPLSVRLIQMDIKKAKEKFGFSKSKRITPHVFRHTGATHLRREGMDISELQDILGHSSPNTTRIYAKNDITRIAISYKQKHPLCKNKNDK